MTENGGILYRVQGEKKYALPATTGYKWSPSKMVKDLGWEEYIDYSYFNKLVDEAYAKIAEFGDPTIFLQ
jgi:hypothetical protein